MRHIILITIISASLVSCSQDNKLNFYEPHMKDFIYKRKEELDADSEYKKKAFLNLSNKKVWIVKTSSERSGKILGNFRNIDVITPEGLTVEDIKKGVSNSWEQRKKNAYQANFEFDDRLYAELPDEFKVLDEKDFKSASIIIQKNYEYSTVGKYTNGVEAHQVTCWVLIYDITEKAFIDQKYFIGTPPPDVIGSHSSSSKSEIPEKEFLNYITTVIKK